MRKHWANWECDGIPLRSICFAFFSQSDRELCRRQVARVYVIFIQNNDWPFGLRAWPLATAQVDTCRLIKNAPTRVYNFGLIFRMITVRLLALPNAMSVSELGIDSPIDARIHVCMGQFNLISFVDISITNWPHDLCEINGRKVKRIFILFITECIFVGRSIRCTRRVDFLTISIFNPMHVAHSVSRMCVNVFSIRPCFSAVVWCYSKSVTGHVNRISISPINWEEKNKHESVPHRFWLIAF